MSLFACKNTIVLPSKSIFSPVVIDPVKHLLALLFKQPQLETLVQLGLLDLPQLEELALSRMNLVQQLHDLGDARRQSRHVRVARHLAWNSNERESNF